MERSGLQHVRGCEVIELRDADGKPMNDFGRARREQYAPPKGTERTLVVALDTAQYQVRMRDAGVPHGRADAAPRRACRSM